jgi:hypothetical protein
MTINPMNRNALLADNPFTKAVRKQVKLKIALVGMPGAGKTYTALTLATQIGGRVALVDSEEESASLFARRFDFDAINFRPPYHPNALINLILAAEAHGYDVLVIDSLSHIWSGKGGMLEIADSVKASSRDKFAGWAKVKPLQHQLVQTILNAKLHIVCTVRGKPMSSDKYVNTEFDTLGMVPDLREEMLFEFDFVGAMGKAHDLHIAKSRVDRLDEVSVVVLPKLAGKRSDAVTYERLAGDLVTWADDGAFGAWLDEDETRYHLEQWHIAYAPDGIDFKAFVAQVLGIAKPCAARYSELATVISPADLEEAVRDHFAAMPDPDPERAPVIEDEAEDDTRDDMIPIGDLTGVNEYARKEFPTGFTAEFWLGSTMGWVTMKVLRTGSSYLLAQRHPKGDKMQLKEASYFVRGGKLLEEKPGPYGIRKYSSAAGD